MQDRDTEGGKVERTMQKERWVGDREKGGWADGRTTGW